LARVDGQNRLDVNSRSNPRIYYASRIFERAFTIHWHFTQDTGGASEYVGYFTYTGDGIVIVDQTFLCTEETGMTAWVWSLRPTGMSGGAEYTPVILNRKSSNSLDITTYHQNDVTAAPISTTSDGTHWFCTRQNEPGTLILNFNDSLILGKNDILMLKCSCATAASKARATIFYYEDVLD